MVFRVWTGLCFAGSLIRSQWIQWKFNRNTPVSVEYSGEPETAVVGRSFDWGPHTDAESQRPFENHENLPDVQGPIRGREGQEIVIDNASTSDSGMATLPPTGSSRTARSSVSLNLFDLAVNRYGFDYPVFDDDDSTEEVVMEDNDDSDNENKENVPPATSTPERGGENNLHQTNREEAAVFLSAD